MPNPTFVLVHGAWHQPAHWTPLIDALAAQGYRAVAPALPSTASASPETLEDGQPDAAAVREAIQTELDAGANVIVVPHSYGGVPTMSSLRSLDRASRAAAGHQTGVVAIAALTSFILPEGVSLFSFAQDQDEKDKRQQSQSQSPTASDKTGAEPLPKPIPDLMPALPSELLYHDLSPGDNDKYTALLKPMSRAALMDHSRFSAHEVLPVYYLLAEDDRAITLARQQIIVEKLRSTGVKVQTELMRGVSHSPFLSRVDETVGFLTRCAEAEN